MFGVFFVGYVGVLLGEIVGGVPGGPRLFFLAGCIDWMIVVLIVFSFWVVCVLSVGFFWFMLGVIILCCGVLCWVVY